MFERRAHPTRNCCRRRDLGGQLTALAGGLEGAASEFQIVGLRREASRRDRLRQKQVLYGLCAGSTAKLCQVLSQNPWTKSP